MMDDIERFSNISMQKASDLMNNTETGSDFKAIIDGVDKLSILTKINERHGGGMVINNTAQATQVKRTLDDFYAMSNNRPQIVISKEEFMEARKQMLIDDDC